MIPIDDNADLGRVRDVVVALCAAVRTLTEKIQANERAIADLQRRLQEDDGVAPPPRRRHSIRAGRNGHI
jgi:hypothetical protein